MPQSTVPNKSEAGIPIYLNLSKNNSGGQSVARLSETVDRPRTELVSLLHQHHEWCCL